MGLSKAAASSVYDMCLLMYTEALASQTARAAKPPVKNTASPLDGSPPPSATTVAVTPLEKSAQQPPESPAVSTHTNESSGATATKESGPHAAETGLSAPGVRGTLGIPLPSAGSPDSRLTSSHGSSTQSPLGEQTKRLLVKKQQGNKFIKEASPVLPVLTETAAAKATRDATATTCTAPSSMQDRLMEGTDSLLMIRRLPAVLTGSLPTLESLGVQVNLPSGADLLSKAPNCRILSA